MQDPCVVVAEAWHTLNLDDARRHLARDSARLPAHGACRQQGPSVSRPLLLGSAEQTGPSCRTAPVEIAVAGDRWLKVMDSRVRPACHVRDEEELSSVYRHFANPALFQSMETLTCTRTRKSARKMSTGTRAGHMKGCLGRSQPQRSCVERNQIIPSKDKEDLLTIHAWQFIVKCAL